VFGLNLEVGKNITVKVAGITFDADIIWSTLVAMVIVLGICFYVRRKITSGVPGKLQLVLEELYLYLKSQISSVNLPGAKSILAMAFTLFVFILCANWLEAIPSGHNPEYLISPSGNVNFTLALSFSVIVFIHIQAIRAKGIKGYIKHYFQPYWFMIVFSPLEEASKPVTLGLRLFGNLFAGGIMLGLIASLPFYFPTFVLDLVWKPIDLFVGVIQAYIFTLLSIVYYNGLVGELH